MSIEALKLNISQERDLAGRIESMILEYQGMVSPLDKQVMEEAIFSVQNQLKILNESIPDLLDNIKLAKKLPGGKSGKKSDLITITYKEGEKENLVTIHKGDKDKYLQQLQISGAYLRELKKKGKKVEEEFEQEFKSPSSYVKISNKFFNNYATRLIEKGSFTSLKTSLQKGGFTILFNSYVAMMLFTTFISFIIAVFIGLFALFFNVSIIPAAVSFVDYTQAGFISRFAIVFFSVLFTPVLVFLAMFYYPSTEQASTESRIDYELPFVTIQMAAIAGADIEPSNIFRIIALGKEYPNVQKEAKKLLNQINLYGYSLGTALRNNAMVSPSKSWADLLNGISTTIRSGGNLSRFLNKRAETLLFEYRLKREKSTKFAETFMDIYISVVIAAPMLMMLLLVMMSISGLGLNLPLWMIALMIVMIVSVINLLFLMFLHLNQKKV